MMLNLNRQFCIIVLVGLVLSSILLDLATKVLEPVLYRFYPLTDQVKESLEELEKELYSISDNPDWYIEDDTRISEIDRLEIKYTKFEISYEFYPGIDARAFKLQDILQKSELSESYVTTILNAVNGVVLVGVNNKKISQFSGIIGIVILVCYIVILLTVIAIFVSKKVRYLKRITRELEILAAGDLSARVPIKGNDEITHVARHINSMATALLHEMKKEKEVENTRNQLITNISHDLRTPLTTILGYLSILESMDIDSIPQSEDKYRHYLRRAYEKSSELSRLVDQLFEYVLLSNRNTTFVLESIHPYHYYLQVFNELESMVEKQELEFVYQLMLCEDVIRVDLTQFKRVIENLMQNLIKYAKSNSTVLVEGYLDMNQYILQITNESKETLEENCDFLSRYFTTDRTSGKSAGLGLSICKELIEQQRGTLTIRAKGKEFQTIIAMPLGEEQYECTN